MVCGSYAVHREASCYFETDICFNPPSRCSDRLQFAVRIAKASDYGARWQPPAETQRLGLPVPCPTTRPWGGPPPDGANPRPRAFLRVLEVGGSGANCPGQKPRLRQLDAPGSAHRPASGRGRTPGPINRVRPIGSIPRLTVSAGSGAAGKSTPPRPRSHGRDERPPLSGMRARERRRTRRRARSIACSMPTTISTRRGTSSPKPSSIAPASDWDAADGSSWGCLRASRLSP
jgi:hypothetical protein